MKYQTLEGDRYQINVEKTSIKIKNSETTKRTDIKRTLVGFSKSDTSGFRLQRNVHFKIPLPKAGNNFQRNHSQIGKENIYRKYKGPLYNDAGRICIDLTEKYIQLETFRFQTQLDSM